MKKLLQTVIEKIEKHGKYLPFDSHEPIVTNSQK
jgi:hypothetical protein